MYGLAVFMHKFKIQNPNGLHPQYPRGQNCKQCETRLALTSSSENVIRIRLMTVRQ